MTERIEQCISALAQAGIPTRRGYPGDPVPPVTEPTAAVCVQQQRRGSLTLALNLYCPPALGGSAWEAAAAQAAAALEALGAACTINGCGFHRESGLLSGLLLVSWGEAAAETGTIDCQIFVDGTILPHLTAFSAKQAVDLQPVQAMGEGIVGYRQEQRVWTLTVEELLPGSSLPVENGIGGFTLAVQRSGGRETFPDCRWVSTQRQEVGGGVRQVRIAKTWAERSITHE